MWKLYEEYVRHKQIQEFIVLPAIMTVWNVNFYVLKHHSFLNHKCKTEKQLAALTS